MLPLTLSANNQHAVGDRQITRRDFYSPVSIQIINTATVQYSIPVELAYSGVEEEITETPVDTKIETPVGSRLEEGADITRDEFLNALMKVSSPIPSRRDSEKSETSA